MARLPVSYTSSLSFCHSSHVVVYFILLSVVSKFCSGLLGIFSSHTCTEYTLHILSNHFVSAITNDVFVYQAVVQ